MVWYNFTMKIQIEIDTKTFVRFWLVLTGFAAALLAVYSAREALMLLIIAFFLALALNTPVHYLAKHLPGGSRVTGTAVAYIAVVLALLAFIFLAVPPMIQQTSKFVEAIPELSSQTASQWNGLGALIDRYELWPYVNNAVDSVQGSMADLAANAGRNVVHGAGSVVRFTASSFFVIVLTFLMLVEGPLWLSRLWKLYGNKELMERHRRLAYQMYRVVTGYVTGQLSVAAIGALFAGLAVFIMSFIFDIPGSLTLPTIALTFVISLIPVFGATVAGILVALLLAFSSVPAAIIYISYFFIYQQIENNFIAPVIQSRRLELSPLAILVAVTIGLYVLGILGGLISIPIAGSLKVLIDDFLNQSKQNAKQKRSPLAELANKVTKAAKKSASAS